MSDLGRWPALVLTAGLATRLRPLSSTRAKAAMPIAGSAIVVRILHWLREAGIQPRRPEPAPPARERDFHRRRWLAVRPRGALFVGSHAARLGGRSTTRASAARRRSLLPDQRRHPDRLLAERGRRATPRHRCARDDGRGRRRRGSLRRSARRRRGAGHRFRPAGRRKPRAPLHRRAGGQRRRFRTAAGRSTERNSAAALPAAHRRTGAARSSPTRARRSFSTSARRAITSRP